MRRLTHASLDGSDHAVLQRAFGCSLYRIQSPARYVVTEVAISGVARVDIVTVSRWPDDRVRCHAYEVKAQQQDIAKWMHAHGSPWVELEKQGLGFTLVTAAGLRFDIGALPEQVGWTECVDGAFICRRPALVIDRDPTLAAMGRIVSALHREATAADLADYRASPEFQAKLARYRPSVA